MGSDDERKRRRERRYRNYVAKTLEDRKYRQRVKDNKKKKLLERLTDMDLEDGA